MTDTNETGGILKEEAKKWRGASNAMNIDATAPQLSPTTLSSEPGTFMGQVGAPAADAVGRLSY